MNSRQNFAALSRYLLKPQEVADISPLPHLCAGLGQESLLLVAVGITQDQSYITPQEIFNVKILEPKGSQKTSRSVEAAMTLFAALCGFEDWPPKITCSHR